MTKRSVALAGLLFMLGIAGSGMFGAYASELLNPTSRPMAAPIGTGFTYQGSLADSGNPANGAYDFEFKLYNAASTGTQVGSTVMKDDVTVAAGFFTVELDFGDHFDGTAYWLEIGVRPGASSDGYQQILPRQPLTAVPYANYASIAPWSGLSGVPTDFADNVDNNTTYLAGNQLDLSGTTFNVQEGPDSGLDADTVDGQHFSTRTGYLFVPAAAFGPSTGSTDFANNGESYSGIMMGTGGSAPVYLPHGASVTKVTFYWADSHTTNDGFLEFRRYSPGSTSDVMAVAYTAGYGGTHESSFDNSIDYPTFDNSTFAYYLKWSLPLKDLSERVIGYAVLIEYSYEGLK